jgi:hypothetical protein
MFIFNVRPGVKVRVSVRVLVCFKSRDSVKVRVSVRVKTDSSSV